MANVRNANTYYIDATGNLTIQNVRVTHVIYTPTRTIVASSSAVDTGADTVTSASHGLANGTIVTYTTNGTVITGLTDLQSYYIVGTATNTFQLSLTSGGAAIDLTGAGAGSHFFSPVNQIIIKDVTTGATKMNLSVPAGGDPLFLDFTDNPIVFPNGVDVTTVTAATATLIGRETQG